MFSTSTSFQFQTGSIKREIISRINDPTLKKFQFHTGSIKSKSLSACSASVISCFNSKLVRLKAFSECHSSQNNCVFQFQTGSIKSSASSLASVIACRFQFHTGSIKSFGTRSLSQLQNRFNSILVRLKGRPYNIRRACKSVSIPNWFD